MGLETDDPPRPTPQLDERAGPVPEERRVLLDSPSLPYSRPGSSSQSTDVLPVVPQSPKGGEVNTLWCTFGIVASLMTYGVLQERIMTTPFEPEGRLFTASVFLVLVNRIVTLILAVAVSLWYGQPLRPMAPLPGYAGISLSNTLATTCQYDVLKYVSFPVATLGKCAKMIPVMIWGTLMNRKSYSYTEYVIAIIVTLGCTMFTLTGEIRSRVLAHHLEGVEYLYGGLLMATYLACDGFTSTLQERLFHQYKNVTICNQIIYCCMWSSILALSTALSDGQLWTALRFIADYPSCIWEILALSVSAGTAQLFISLTIKKHGALAFATIMTTRQFLSILVSCAVFLHPLTLGQWVSTALIFGALYCKIGSKTSCHIKRSDFGDPTKECQESKDTLRMHTTSSELAFVNPIQELPLQQQPLHSRTGSGIPMGHPTRVLVSTGGSEQKGSLEHRMLSVAAG